MSFVRRRVWLAVPLILAGVLSPRSDSLAAVAEKTWEIGGFAHLSRFASSTNIDIGYGVGGRAGYYFKPIHQLEGTVDRLSADNKEVSGVTMDVTKLSVDYVRIFP